MPIDRNEITKEQIAKAMQCKTAEELIAFEEALKKVAGGNYVSCPIHCLTDCPRYGKGANCRRYGNT